MQNYLPSIDLEIATKLKDKGYRQRFFLVEASANIARQLIELRKLRQLTQADLARLAGTGQPAISRVERADYHNWSFKTLRSLAETMDARIRVLIEPAEQVLSEYEAPKLNKLSYFPATVRIEPATDRIEDLVGQIFKNRSQGFKKEGASILDFEGPKKSAANVKSETEQRTPELVNRLTHTETWQEASTTKHKFDLAGAA